MGDLEFAEAGFVTGLGKYRVKWVRGEVDGVCYTVQVQTPRGTEGSVVLPWEGRGKSRPAVMVNGRVLKAEVVALAEGTASFALAGGEYEVLVC
jgi:hypothetical protein